MMIQPVFCVPEHVSAIYGSRCALRGGSRVSIFWGGIFARPFCIVNDQAKVPGIVAVSGAGSTDHLEKAHFGNLSWGPPVRPGGGRGTCTSPLVTRVAKKKRMQMLNPDAVKVESGKYGYELECAINQLSALLPRASVARCLESYRNKLSLKDFSLMFREFAQRGDWQRSLRLFRYMQRQQWCKPNEHIYSIVIGILGREGLLEKCTEVFDEMPEFGVERTAYAYTALINAYGRNGQYEASLHLLDRMKRERISPTLLTYNTVINACAKCGLEWEGLLGLFAQMRHEGVQPDIITYNALMNACNNRGGLLEEAKMVFRTMNEAGVVPDLATYTNLVGAFSEAGELDAVRDLLREMEEAGNLPDVTGYNTLIEAYSKQVNISGAAGVFRQMLLAGCSPNVSTYSTLLECYGKQGCFDEVRKLFTDMKASGTEPDSITFNTLINVFGNGGFFKEAVSLYRDIINGNVEPDMQTYTGLLYACGMAGFHKDARDIFKHMLDKGLKPTPEAFDGVINAYGKAAFYEEAAIAFDQIEELECEATESNYSTLISVFAKGGLYREAESILSKMQEAGFPSNLSTYNSFIEVYGRSGLFDDCMGIYMDMLQAGCTPSLETYEVLLNVYCIGGLFDGAWAQFLEMKQAGSVLEVTAYCLCFSICARRSRWNDANKLLLEMQSSNMSSLHSVTSCLIQGNFDEDSNWGLIVQPALDAIKVNGITSNIHYYNSLLDALWWSGQRARAVKVLAEARRRGVFPEAFQKSEVIWSLDVHRMSVGAGSASLLVWLEDLQTTSRISADGLPPLLTIVTERSILVEEEDDSEVPISKALYHLLESLGAPFKRAPWNPARLLSYSKLLKPWLDKSSLDSVSSNIPLPSPSDLKQSNSDLSFGSMSGRSKELTPI